MAKKDDTLEYVLRLGDNVLILSQRLSEWCGKGPAFEEDMALTNTALDLIGQARMWLTYAGELEGRGRDEDRLAFTRDAHEFRNLLLVEQPNGDYAATLARQFYFDTWHALALQALVQSSDRRIAEIAEKSLKEVRYHVRRSADLVMRLGDGTEESHRRMQNALDDLWVYTGEMFIADGRDAVLACEGIVPEAESLREPWLKHVTDVLAEGRLKVPSGTWMQKGGKQGRHTEHLGYILAEMQFLQRSYPNAQW